MLGNASYVNLRSWILPCGESPNELLSCKTGINQLVHFPKSGMESLVEEKAQAEYKFLFLTFLSLAVARLLGISHNLFSCPTQQLPRTYQRQHMHRSTIHPLNQFCLRPTTCFCCLPGNSRKFGENHSL